MVHTHDRLHCVYGQPSLARALIPPLILPRRVLKRDAQTREEREMKQRVDERYWR